MHDIFVLYNKPQDREVFDRYYESTHVGLVGELPLLKEFTWGKVVGDEEACYLVARLTYASKADADASMASEAGRASVADLANFAHAGATVMNVPRIGES